MQCFRSFIILNNSIALSLLAHYPLLYSTFWCLLEKLLFHEHYCSFLSDSLNQSCFSLQIDMNIMFTTQLVLKRHLVSLFQEALRPNFKEHLCNLRIFDIFSPLRLAYRVSGDIFIICFSFWLISDYLCPHLQKFWNFRNQ